MNSRNENVLAEIFRKNIRILEISSSRPFFAGTVSGCSLEELANDDIIEEVKAALDIFDVLVFRALPLTNPEHLLLGERLGSRLHRKTGIAAISANRFADDRKRLYGLSNRLWRYGIYKYSGRLLFTSR